ncbi:hypothetical protein BTO06_03655 [Tenacibaculum sp. SZ-18]|uniref:hypothetical protein n=1 Tax=Tenacibaculum sp. SZ-18 TaxID=754423 RepID=UPI000C2D63E0|nr:hypothetical protein [Tenacibaculum sp. SZ-18]AUC14292.1 hypothetical protein BTO06_03655 [Tenacibaculum sp. SZ-18]
MKEYKFNFFLVDGQAVVDSEQIKILKNGGFLKELKTKGWFIIVSALIIYRIQQSIFSEDFDSPMDYVGFGLRLVVILIIVALVFYYSLRFNWKNTIKINDIESIIVEEDEIETELTILTSNKREKLLEFRTLENQSSNFIEALQKRNSRIVIKNR